VDRKSGNARGGISKWKIWKKGYFMKEVYKPEQKESEKSLAPPTESGSY
jgi:hypothetical protein